MMWPSTMLPPRTPQSLIPSWFLVRTREDESGGVAFLNLKMGAEDPEDLLVAGGKHIISLPDHQNCDHNKMCVSHQVL